MQYTAPSSTGEPDSCHDGRQSAWASTCRSGGLSLWTSSSSTARKKRFITSQEVKQIARRAGRRGIYDIGYVCTARENPYFLQENLETEDEPIREAVLGPGEAITQIKGLPLREKLALWSTTEEGISNYAKMDVRDYLLILDSLRPFKLPEDVHNRLMLLPFDGKDTELLQCFSGHMSSRFFIRKEPASQTGQCRPGALSIRKVLP